jgi:hypothetical protein
MKKIFKLTFSLGLALLSFGLYSCSQDDDVLSQEPVTKSVVTPVSNERITVGELIEIVKSDCKDHELSFLNNLPKDMKVYVYAKGSKTYPSVTENEIGEISSLISNRETIKVMPLEMPSAKDLKVNVSATTRGYTEARSVTDMPILAFTSGTFGYMEVVATVNYIYDVEEHIITEAKSIICDLDDSAYIGEYILDWADKGSTITVSGDKIGLLYNVNGDVILGKSIGGLPLGFVCVEFRGKTGEIVVPYSL